MCLEEMTTGQAAGSTPCCLFPLLIASFSMMLYVFMHSALQRVGHDCPLHPPHLVFSGKNLSVARLTKTFWAARFLPYLASLLLFTGANKYLWKDT